MTEKKFKTLNFTVQSQSVSLDTQTIKEQAQSYLLRTLSIHVDMLFAEWSASFKFNHSVSSHHVQHLVEQFQIYEIY